MVSCLEEKLAKMSQSFTDQGLRYMFLINNSTYMLQQLQTTYGNNLHSYFAALDRRIEDYIQAYLKLCGGTSVVMFAQSYTSLLREKLLSIA
jgi:hypothetical protein